MTVVTFVLPTADEDDWVRTGRGFRARQAYKDHKKGIGKMKTIQVEVEVEVRDDEEIVDFLETLVSRTEHEKVQQILRMDEGQPLLQNLEADAEKRGKLQQLKGQFRHQPKANMDLSDWLAAAEQQGYLPLPDSKDETDADAIAAANKKPEEKDEDNDQHMDEV